MTHLTAEYSKQSIFNGFMCIAQKVSMSWSGSSQLNKMSNILVNN